MGNKRRGGLQKSMKIQLSLLPAAQQLVDLPVSFHQAQDRAIPRQLLHRRVLRLSRKLWIQLLQHRSQTRNQHYLALHLAT